MTILYLMAYWYTYSKWYILGSWFVTYLLNVAFKKLWLSPLLVNAVAIAMLAAGIYFKMIQGKEVGSSMLNVYMPIVFASILFNIIIFSYRKITNYIKNNK